MPYDWKAIQKSTGETRLYRLIGEMHSKRASEVDLTNIRDLLLEDAPGPDAWQTLGEGLHRTTKGGQVGYRIWEAWTRSISTDEIADLAGDLEEIWQTFGDSSPRPPVIEPEDDSPTDVIAVEIRDDSSDNTGPTHTAVIKFPKPKLMAFVPQGPYTIRFLGEEFHSVDEYAIVDLLRRGLLLGAEVEYHGEWVTVANHPAFDELTAVLKKEVKRVLEAAASQPIEKSSVTTQVVQSEQKSA